MMRLCFLSGILFVGCLGFGSLTPALAFDSAKDYVQTQLLPPQLLLPPPMEGSKAWHQEIEGVLKAQKDLSQDELESLKDEQHIRLEMMTSVLGSSFTREELPKTFALLDHVLSGAGRICDADKEFWHTRRPYLTDARVKLYVDPIDSSPSYPSGHTTETRVLAEVLGMLVPSSLPELRARADMIARHRIEAGVHYPGDIEGGKSLAMLIVGSLTANDDFQDDLADAQQELMRTAD